MSASKFKLVVLSVVTIMFVMTGAVVASSSASARMVPGDSRGPALHHPCDINRDGRQRLSTENLCLRVWDQESFTVRQAGSVNEYPAGPVLVVELVDEWRLEGAGESYLRTGLQNIRDEYANREL